MTDETTPLPRAIQREQDELDQLEALLREQQHPSAPQDEAPAEDASPAPEPAPTEAPAPVEPPAPVEVPEAKWEEKYRRLQGKYDAEVPRLHAELKDLRQALEALKAAKVETPEPPKEDPRLVTKEDEETFGAELIELQRRVAREEAAAFQKILESLRAENEQLKAQVERTGSDVTTLGFNTQLQRLVPDFAEINTDKRWIAWLDEVDPILRGPRRAIAQAAFERGDAEGVAHYVNLFKQSLAPVQAQSQKQAELAKQVQPTRAHTPTVDTRQPKTYSAAEAEAIFKRVQQLSIRGDFEAAQKLEDEISQAYIDGRVTA